MGPGNVYPDQDITGTDFPTARPKRLVLTPACFKGGCHQRHVSCKNALPSDGIAPSQQIVIELTSWFLIQRWDWLAGVSIL